MRPPTDVGIRAMNQKRTGNHPAVVALFGASCLEALIRIPPVRIPGDTVGAEVTGGIAVCVCDQLVVAENSATGTASHMKNMETASCALMITSLKNQMMY